MAATISIVETNHYQGIGYYGVPGAQERGELAHVVIDLSHECRTIAVYHDAPEGTDLDEYRDAIRKHVASWGADACYSGDNLMIQWHPGRDQAETEIVMVEGKLVADLRVMYDGGAIGMCAGEWSEGPIMLRRELTEAEAAMYSAYRGYKIIVDWRDGIALLLDDAEGWCVQVHSEASLEDLSRCIKVPVAELMCE